MDFPWHCCWRGCWSVFQNNCRTGRLSLDLISRLDKTAAFRKKYLALSIIFWLLRLATVSWQNAEKETTVSMMESTHTSILVKKANILEVKECPFLSSKRRFLISIQYDNNFFFLICWSLTCLKIRVTFCHSLSLQTNGLNSSYRHFSAWGNWIKTVQAPLWSQDQPQSQPPCPSKLQLQLI